MTQDPRSRLDELEHQWKDVLAADARQSPEGNEVTEVMAFADDFIRPLLFIAREQLDRAERLERLLLKADGLAAALIPLIPHDHLSGQHPLCSACKALYAWAVLDSLKP